MHEQEYHPGCRVVVTLLGHPPIYGTIVEVKPFYFRGQGPRVVVQCDALPGHSLSGTRGEYRADELQLAAK